MGRRDHGKEWEVLPRHVLARLRSDGAVALAEGKTRSTLEHPVQMAGASSAKAAGSRCLGSMSRPSS